MTINKAMLMLAQQPKSIFIGQGVKYDGVATYKDLEGIPEDQRIEMPVAEELQLGICTGLALQGYLPICIFPRMDFMLRAADQLVNHLDKLEEMSCGQFKPKVIIRTKVGTKTPLNAGPQHTKRYTDAFNLMLTNIKVIEIINQELAIESYKIAISTNCSTVVVEYL